METNSIYNKVISEIEEDREELVKLCLDLGNTPSPHGKERKVGEKVLAWLNDRGIKGFLQCISDESVNVWPECPAVAAAQV